MPQTQVQNLKDRILTKQNKNQVELLIQVHEQFLALYGWVPFEEFKKLPMDTIFNLIDAAYARLKKEQKRIKKPKAARRH
jgi:hypothetical protein